MKISYKAATSITRPFFILEPITSRERLNIQQLAQRKRVIMMVRISEHLKVVGVRGSLCKRSTSLDALKIALEGAASADAETELFDIKSLSPPLYNPEINVSPDPVIAFCDALHAADGLIRSSPMYNDGAIRGSFKNVLDWLHWPVAALVHSTSAVLQRKSTRR